MKVYLELTDIALMEEVASSQRDKLLIRLLSRLGCRVSEALAIKVRDIDFKQSTVTILHLKRRINVSCPSCRTRLGNQHQYCPVCGKRVDDTLKRQQEKRRIRVLPIDQRSIDMLRDYLSHDKTYVDGNKPLFCISRHRVWQIVRECARRAGLPSLINPETGRIRGASPHRLRDAFSVHAMKLNDTGDGLRLLQEHLGHASFNTTARYRKIAGTEHRVWYDNLWDNND
ncbi:tyrosine-type recombinase/integrase [Chloroflexota bacterium]